MRACKSQAGPDQGSQFCVVVIWAFASAVGQRWHRSGRPMYDGGIALGQVRLPRLCTEHTASWHAVIYKDCRSCCEHANVPCPRPAAVVLVNGLRTSHSAPRMRLRSTWCLTVAPATNIATKLIDRMSCHATSRPKGSAGIVALSAFSLAKPPEGGSAHRSGVTGSEARQQFPDPVGAVSAVPGAGLKMCTSAAFTAGLSKVAPSPLVVLRGHATSQQEKHKEGPYRRPRSRNELAGLASRTRHVLSTLCQTPRLPAQLLRHSLASSSWPQQCALALLSNLPGRPGAVLAGPVEPSRGRPAEICTCFRVSRRRQPAPLCLAAGQTTTAKQVVRSS